MKNRLASLPSKLFIFSCSLICSMLIGAVFMYFAPMHPLCTAASFSMVSSARALTFILLPCSVVLEYLEKAQKS